MYKKTHSLTPKFRKNRFRAFGAKSHTPGKVDFVDVCTPFPRQGEPPEKKCHLEYGTMKKLLPMCGMSKEEAGCHSFRRGTATDLAHINAPSYVIKGIGIWGSDAYLGYIDATESGSMERAMLEMAEADPTCVLGPRGVAR